MATSRRFGRRRRAVLERLTVTAGLAAFVVAVYVLVVLGGGAALGRTESPSLALSVLATAGVALLFAPVQAALEQIVVRQGGGRQSTPYDVLRRFSDGVIGSHASDDLPARMAELLTRGTGAQWAQVWLMVSNTLTLSATWPPDADADREVPDVRPDTADADAEGRRCLTVLNGSTVLGALRLQERAAHPLTLVEVRLFRGLAAQAGLVLRLVGLQAELETRRRELLLRAEELQSSRERLIETQDTERRRLERDLHDGAQQHLVALAVNLRLAQSLAERSGERSRSILGEQADAARAAIDTLSSLSRGIYPRLLSEEGLVSALRGASASSAVPVTVAGEGGSRPPAAVEAGGYFCGLEAVQNAAKHAAAGGIAVRYEEDAATWRLTVADDGTGFVQLPSPTTGRGAGLANMRDRLDAVGGTVAVVSGRGEGTTVTACVAKRTMSPATDVVSGRVR